MPAPIHIDLTAEEDRTLQELSLANGVQRRIKLRAIGLRLNADGWTVPQIAAHLKQSEHTIRNTIKRWCTGGVGDCGKRADGVSSSGGRTPTSIRLSSG